MEKSSGFFEWVVKVFKKKEVVLPPKPSYQELAAEAKWLLIKSKYRLEYLKEHRAYFVQYQHKNGEWWYLRRWTEDYTLERARGNAIRIGSPHELDALIKLHQEWVDGGHIFMSFD